MQQLLRTRIALLRRALQDSDDPSIGFIAPPSTHRAFPAEIPGSYQAFLRESDGAACGVVLLFESEDILKFQAPAKALPGGRQCWFCIGSVNEIPLFLERRMNSVHLLDPEAAWDPDDSPGDLEHFLLTCVFDTGYEEFASDPSDDPWLDLLQSCLGRALP